MSPEETARALAALTEHPGKRALFSEDSFFREGLSDARVALGDVLPTALAPIALVLFKPDAVAARKVAPALALLREDGFAPVAAAPLAFTGPVIHALWRYQIRRNTIDKIRLYTRWASRVPALLVLFRDEADGRPLRGAARMSAAKGPALVERREPWHLRTRLGSPNSILNFLHSADEMVDVLRELPILADADVRPRLLAAIRTGADAGDLAPVLADLAARIPEHDADPRAAALRLRAAAAGMPGAPARDLVERIDATLSGRSRLDLYALETAIAALGLEPDPLDVFAFGSHFIDRDIAGLVGEIEAAGARA